MKIKINIGKNVNHQFKDHLGGRELSNGFVINPEYGTNQAKCIYLVFPGKLECYHFGLTKFREPIEMNTINPADSEWLLIHINLARYSQKKKVGNETIYFHRSLPIGILFCGPGLEMNTIIPKDIETEVLSIRFHKEFIKLYLPDISNTINLDRHIAYEDIDDELGTALIQVIKNMDNKLSCHAHLLTFLNYFFEKISKHQKPNNTNKLHPDDLRRILEISSLLRNPQSEDIPSLEELSQKAHMGMTKFKDSFKLVFGMAPLQYRNRIRMEYAREELLNKKKSASELSYELGYAHPSNFTAAFKRFFGKLPSSF